MENKSYPFYNKNAKIVGNTAEHKFIIGQIIWLDYSDDGSLVGKINQSVEVIESSHGMWYFINAADFILLEENVTDLGSLRINENGELVWS